MKYSTVIVETVDSVVHVKMNRPEVRNAFNSLMIEELTDAFEQLKTAECRSVQLEGEGHSFCAGADLNWMRAMKDADRRTNIQDANALANLMEVIYSHPKPVIAKVHGAAMGGGVGLVSVCDIAVALRSTIFSFSEVKLGLIPSVIGPYVVRKIGLSSARKYMLTAQQFDAAMAEKIGLIHHVAVKGDLEASTRGFHTAFGLAGPEAITACKELIHRCGEDSLEQLKKWTAEKIADLRIGPEGQEGMSAFLERRDPSWIPDLGD